MSSGPKFYATTFLSLLCLGLMAMGLRNMLIAQRGAGIRGVGFVFGGAGIGITSAILAQYYGVRRHEHKDADQVATETLAKFAGEKLSSKRKN